jgi:flagellar hook-associated protein 1 FlgK
MSISTFTGLETALRAVLAQQQALNVTGHNIANASTTGYTRQSTQLQASTPLQVSPGMLLGTGVDVVSYQRIRDQFLDVQLRAQTMLQGAADASSNGLGQVEGVFNEPSDTGLNSLLGQYWSAWQNVANSPEDVATRQALVEAATSLATGFNSISSQLTTIGTQTATNTQLTLDEVNANGADIVSLNTAIYNAKAVGNTPNDLLDQRDVVLDKLSKLGNVSVTDLGDGTVKVMFDGVTLVDGVTNQTLTESGGTITNALTPTPETATPGATTGKLGALIALRDTTIPAYKTQLDKIASTLITQTNAYQAGGVDANGVTQTGGFDLAGTAGIAFFTGTNASTIAVNVTAAQVAAASATGKPGDNTNALRIAAMANDSTLTPLGGTTINGAYAQLVTAVGSDAQAANRQSSNAKVLVDTLTSRRESVSGVSLDEEMTNMIRFQQGYQAAARALTAMDDALSLLITRTGRAGL